MSSVFTRSKLAFNASASLTSVATDGRVRFSRKSPLKERCSTEEIRAPESRERLSQPVDGSGSSLGAAEPAPVDDRKATNRRALGFAEPAHLANGVVSAHPRIREELDDEAGDLLTLKRVGPCQIALHDRRQGESLNRRAKDQRVVLRHIWPDCELEGPVSRFATADNGHLLNFRRMSRRRKSLLQLLANRKRVPGL